MLHARLLQVGIWRLQLMSVTSPQPLEVIHTHTNTHTYSLTRWSNKSTSRMRVIQMPIYLRALQRILHESRACSTIWRQLMKFFDEIYHMDMDAVCSLYFIAHNVCTMEKIDDPCQNTTTAVAMATTKRSKREWTIEWASERAREREWEAIACSIKYVINVFQLDI